LVGIESQGNGVSENSKVPRSKFAVESREPEVDIYRVATLLVTQCGVCLYSVRAYSEAATSPQPDCEIKRHSRE
jgi:hypothetical protein